MKPGFRNRCRISCGADNVIHNVLPYLLPAAKMKGNAGVGKGGEGDSSDEDKIPNNNPM